MRQTCKCPVAPRLLIILADQDNWRKTQKSAWNSCVFFASLYEVISCCFQASRAWLVPDLCPTYAPLEAQGTRRWSPNSAKTDTTSLERSTETIHSSATSATCKYFVNKLWVRLNSFIYVWSVRNSAFIVQQPVGYALFIATETLTQSQTMHLYTTSMQLGTDTSKMLKVERCVKSAHGRVSEL